MKENSSGILPALLIDEIDIFVESEDDGDSSILGGERNTCVSVSEQKVMLLDIDITSVVRVP